MPKSLEKLTDLSGFPATEIIRVFDAPRELVYRAWTEPRHMARWWGPQGFTNPRCDMDVRVGGSIHIDMKAPNGVVYPMPGVFTLVDPPKALAFRCGAADGDGDQIFEALNSVRFEDEPGGKTRIHLLATIQWARAEAVPMWGGNVPGWNQSLVRLAALLAESQRSLGDPEASLAPFSISRIFDAPRELVYKVHTQPAHLAKWFGPAGGQVIKAEMDLRPGGTYHYGLRLPGGQEMWGRQVFREVVAPERLVYIQSFSDKDGGVTRHPMSPAWPLEMLATSTFEEVAGGKTKLTISWRPYKTDGAGLAAFDGARPGMDQGFAGTFAALEAYLATLDHHL